MVRAELIALFSERILHKELKEEKLMKLAEGENFVDGSKPMICNNLYTDGRYLGFPSRACMSTPSNLYINAHRFDVSFYGSIDVLIDDRRLFSPTQCALVDHL